MRISYLLLPSLAVLALLGLTAFAFAAPAAPSTNAPACSFSPAALASLSQPGAERYFLRLGELQGCSTDTKHAGWVQFEDYSCCTINPGHSLLGGPALFASPSGRPDFTLVKLSDASSQALQDAVTSGRIFPLATIDVSRGGVQPERVLTLANVQVTRFRVLGPAGDNLSAEEVTLSYSKMSWTYPDVRTPAPAAGVHTHELMPNERIGTPLPSEDY